MRQLLQRVDRFIRSEDGPTTVEYAVMLASIIIVCLLSINTLGTNTKMSFTNTANSIGSSVPKTNDVKFSKVLILDRHP